MKEMRVTTTRGSLLRTFTLTDKGTAYEGHFSSSPETVVKFFEANNRKFVLLVTPGSTYYNRGAQYVGAVMNLWEIVRYSDATHFEARRWAEARNYSGSRKLAIEKLEEVATNLDAYIAKVEAEDKEREDREAQQRAEQIRLADIATIDNAIKRFGWGDMLARLADRAQIDGYDVVASMLEDASNKFPVTEQERA